MNTDQPYSWLSNFLRTAIIQEAKCQSEVCINHELSTGQFNWLIVSLNTGSL